LSSKTGHPLQFNLEPGRLCKMHQVDAQVNASKSDKYVNVRLILGFQTFKA
jgi:hypothetical protein